MDTDVAIIGAGFGGLGAAIRLQRAGFTDFLVFDRGEDVGGTWRDNSYPGCACDVPSHLYSFSFAPNPRWSNTFSSQPEIWDYLRGCVDRFGIRPRLRLRHEVRGAVGRPAPTLAGAHLRRRPQRPGPDLCRRPAQRPGHPRPARDRRVRRHGVPLRPLAARPRPDRPARRGDRHRRLGRPVRATDPADGREADALPAHPRLDHAEDVAPDQRGRAGRVPHRARRATGRPGRALSGTREHGPGLPAPGGQPPRLAPVSAHAATSGS